jgi:SAM-dependent methyltransferase
VTTPQLRDCPYLPGMTIEDYADLVREQFPGLVDTLWLDRPGAEDALRLLADVENEFEDDGGVGRGESYRRAQQKRMVRSLGMRSLFALAAGVATPAGIPRDWRLLDVLGGDGLLAHVLRTVAPQVENPPITSDMAGNMILAALRGGLPAIRQLAQFLFLRDETMDAVIIAYGTHHIGPKERPVACREAARVLRPGGRLVLHDFEEGGAVAQWFSEVVHRYSRRGHPYTHFTANEMEFCLRSSGLRAVSVRRMYDPLILEGNDRAEVRSLLADYLFEMYGLVGLADHTPPADVRDAVWKLAQNYFIYRNGDGPDHDGTAWQREPVVYRTDTGWVAEVPRVALVAVGEKSDT